MSRTVFANEQELIKHHKSVFVQAEDNGKRIFVAVNARGFTDYPMPMKYSDGKFATLWDRPEAFTPMFRSKVTNWMREHL